MVVEAKKSDDLLPAKGRTRKAGGGFSRVRRPENQGADGTSPGMSPTAWSRSPMSEGRTRGMSPLRQRKFRLPPCSIQGQRLISPRTTHRHPQKSRFITIRASLSPVQWAHGIKHRSDRAGKERFQDEEA